MYNRLQMLLGHYKVVLVFDFDESACDVDGNRRENFNT